MPCGVMASSDCCGGSHKVGEVLQVGVDLGVGRNVTGLMPGGLETW